MEFTHTETILDLLVKQQSQDAQVGLRLAFHPSLLRKIRLLCDPYHYAAMTGDTALVLHMAYGLGLAVGPPLPVAEFSANGPVSNSTTPWTKVVSVTPSEVALLSGHAQAAEVLQLVEKGVPLEWHREVHSKFPEAFKKKVRAQVELLCSSGLLCQLPGPARFQLITLFAAQLCSSEVWGCLPSELKACCTTAACSSPAPAAAATASGSHPSSSCSSLALSRKGGRFSPSPASGPPSAAPVVNHANPVNPVEVMNPGVAMAEEAAGGGAAAPATSDNSFHASGHTSNVGQDPASKGMSSSVSTETKLLLRKALDERLVLACEELLDPESAHGSSRTAHLPQYQFRVGGPQPRRNRRLGLLGLVSVVSLGLIALTRRPQIGGPNFRRLNGGVMNAALMFASITSAHVAMDLARACSFLLRR